MRRLQLTFYAPDVEVHPLHTLMVERDYVDAAEMVHWNMVGETITHVFHLAVDRDAFVAELDEIPAVLAYDLTPVGDGRFYATFRAETTPVQREMFSVYESRALVITSALEHTDDGGVTFEVIGEPDALQAASETVPDGIVVEIDSVGGDFGDPETVPSSLTRRQREAVETAVAVGYYDVPRTASHEDVAAELDCAPSTASEHLRKAESKVLRSLFGQ